MVPGTFVTICRRRALAFTAVVCAALGGIPGAAPGAAQEGTPFQIVWVVIGEAASGTDKGSPHAGRQLFMASDLMSKANIKVEQVEVDPAITQLTVGQRLCLTAMNIRVLGPRRKLIEGAPLSIAVRQDHRERLGLRRNNKDICVLPNAAGEYPMRLTSMLPAQDGTMRGAQVFIRVSDPNAANATTATDIP